MSGGGSIVALTDGSFASKVVVVGSLGTVGAAPGGGGGSPAPSAGDGAVNTGTSTQVASTTSATTILAANTARYGASVANDDANVLYLLLGAGTVTSSVYTVKLYTDDIYHVPYNFTGILTGLWAADGSGSARVTEYT